MNASQDPPVHPCFSAVTSSARQLFNILRCVGFVSRAQIQISNDGIRVSVEDSRVMQGHAFLDNKLFTTFTFHPPPPPPRSQQSETQPDEDPDTTVTYNISLSALLECLQLFSADSAHQKSNSNYNSFRAGSVGAGGERGGGGGGPGGIFDQNALRITGTCRLVYEGWGMPLCVILEESGTITTCELTTYISDGISDIPLDRNSLSQKIIMKSSWLHDALLELLPTLPASTPLTFHTTPRAPYFSLTATSPLGCSTTISFSKHQLDTFQASEPTSHSYRFGFVRHAVRAMERARMVSIRGDKQGVLSLQFMIEWEGGADGAMGGGGGMGVAGGSMGKGPSFVEFRILPVGGGGSGSEEGEGVGEVEEKGDGEVEEGQGENGVGDWVI
ncbi:putative DNA repair protein Rad1 [Tirmania nivea]|nr:putative DNA repair protein Rad1 [Tirmania nivea]